MMLKSFQKSRDRGHETGGVKRWILYIHCASFFGVVVIVVTVIFPWLFVIYAYRDWIYEQ